MTTKEVSVEQAPGRELSTADVARSLWWGAALWVGSVALAVLLAIVVAPEADATGSDPVVEHTFIGY